MLSIMANEIKLGNVAGLSLSARPSAILGSILLWVLLSRVAARLLRRPPGEALVGGFIAVVVHWASDIVHQLGNAWAARSTGYPMIGIRLWGVLSASVYPPDEPMLPAAVHIRRALGGPVASLLLTLLAAAIARVLRPRGGMARWIGAFFFLDNLCTFTLGSLVPLNFTDGGSLLYWWGKR